jgi:NAD(P)-dependent dehydrogenase (short-subunit alcohol dehydrogenase family)
MLEAKSGNESDGGSGQRSGQRSEQRVALVTGSTSGIGLAIAQRLSREGYALVLHSRDSSEEGQRLAKSIPGSTYIQADLADQAQVRSLVPRVVADHGRLDVLVNNAALTAIVPHDDLEGAPAELWRELYEVNVIAPWTLIAEARDALVRSATDELPSCVVNITSHAGVRPKGASIPYAVTKAALNHMTRLLAVTLGPQIRVNAIAPGLVDTPMSRCWDAARQLWAERSPMRRQAQPDDVAHVALMLVESKYLTGEVVVCDGGLNLT